MKVVVISVGKIKDRGLRDLIADYVARISHYAKVSEVELTDDDTVEARMRKAIPERARIVAMEVDARA